MISKLLEDLAGAAGMTESQIAARVGCNQSTVNRLRHGQKCGYETGVKIEQLHRETFPDGAPPGASQPEQGRAAA